MALKRIQLLVAAAALTAGTLAVTSAATAQATAPTTGRTATQTDRACAGLLGKSLDITFDNGLEMKFDYAADGTQLTGTVLAVGDSGGNVGVTNTVPDSLATIAKNVYFTSWNEHGGLTVSLTEDLKSGTAQAYWSFPSGGDVRVGQLHAGTIRCLS
ncbi:methionine-rich copper-binding protein CopC [Kitasatospora sp. GAS204A]|uniref:MoaF-related domain-containing protein n=1 Tax=unclassified Kitasatospora TaxID=2633591 RepID=UPI00247653EC|nr:hypothetical protein [Kitasatospora sp. GAS204B]MDH6120748.1 methionine-rich copper-binding protein CopC [Kitasatospora sp. GAS204B]